MKKVLVTGANGQLGRTIQDFESAEGINFVFKTKDDLDITNKKVLKKLFEANTFDFCINCAAYTNVEQAEKTPEIAYKINAEGVKNIAEACKATNTVLIHISTDYVFDGKKITPYTEEDTPNPINEYGKSKLKGEEYVQQILEKYYIVRTSWLYSEYGHNFLKTILKLSKEKDEIQVVDDQMGSPTYAGDLAEVLLKIIDSRKELYGVYHYSNEGSASWYDFASSIINTSDNNSNLSIHPVKTEYYRTLAQRPKYTVLSKRIILEVFQIKTISWKEALSNLIGLNLSMLTFSYN